MGAGDAHLNPPSCAAETNVALFLLLAPPPSAKSYLWAPACPESECGTRGTRGIPRYARLGGKADAQSQLFGWRTKLKNQRLGFDFFGKQQVCFDSYYICEKIWIPSRILPYVLA